ncbi:hypothetical protein [Streptomyces luteogriseus]|uniref:hypothetical protein n=1 Tax=Streptomyces luteogriseus TaxID=68233 RepID=UPI003F4D5A53
MAGAFPAGASAAAFSAGADRAAAALVDAVAGVAFPATAPSPTMPSVSALFGAAFLVTAFLAVVFFSAVVLSSAVFVPPAAFLPPSFAARPAERPCVAFFPPTSLAAPPEASADLPDAGCCTAVFFATMAAAPSHIVTLLANRAGTINRLESHGNGAHRPIRPPRARRAATCIRCAQLLAR